MRYLASMERSPRKVTVVKFHELKRTRSLDSDQLMSEVVGPATPPRAMEKYWKERRDPEA